jgi:hypothetical protein
MSDISSGTPAADLVRDASVQARIPWFSSSHVGSADQLYDVASRAQWHEDDVDWASARPLAELPPAPSPAGRIATERAAPLGRGSWSAYQTAMRAWAISQLLFGEQGALVVTGRLVETLPDMTSKCLAAVQVADEARHVRVMQRYLELNGQSFVPSAEVEALLAGMLQAPSWDYLLLGMQVVLEGVALSIFRSGNTLFSDPLLTEICQRIARDEARHYSFGVVSLADHIALLTNRERRDREDYLAEAVRLMALRFRFDAVWEQLGVPLVQGRRYAATDPDLIALRRVVFRPVVSALRKINLWHGLEDTFKGLDLVER